MNSLPTCKTSTDVCIIIERDMWTFGREEIKNKNAKRYQNKNSLPRLTNMPSPVYLVDHAPYKPPEDYRVIVEDVEKNAKNLPVSESWHRTSFGVCCFGVCFGVIPHAFNL